MERPRGCEFVSVSIAKSGKLCLPRGRFRIARLTLRQIGMPWRSIQATSCGQTQKFSRRVAPEVCGWSRAPEISEGQGKPDASCTRSLARKNWQKAYEHFLHYRCAKHPAFPA